MTKCIYVYMGKKIGGGCVYAVAAVIVAGILGLLFRGFAWVIGLVPLIVWQVLVGVIVGLVFIYAVYSIVKDGIKAFSALHQEAKRECEE
jgi:hypothetical protein